MINIRASTCACGKAVPSFGVQGAPVSAHESVDDQCFSKACWQLCLQVPTACIIPSRGVSFCRFGMLLYILRLCSFMTVIVQAVVS